MAACVAGNPPCYPHLQTPTGFTDGNKNVKYGITESSCDINRHHSPETFMSTSKIQSSDNGHLIASPSDECHFTQTSYPRHSKFLWSSTPNFPSIPCSEGAIGRTIDGDQRESLKGKFCLSTVSTNEGRNKFSIDVTDGAGISSSRTSAETEENSMFPHFKNDNSRLISFKDLSSVHHEKKHKLAGAGFFLTMLQSVVRCYSCGIELKNWNNVEDPMSEHARCSPNCKHLLKLKGRDFIESVQHDTDKKSSQANYPFRKSVGTGATQSRDVEKYPDSTLEKNPLLTDAAQKVVKMGYLPKQVNKAVEEVLKCKDWMRMTSNDIVEKLKEQNVSPLPASNSQLKVSGKLDQANINTIKEEIRTLKERKLCKVCCEEDVSIVFLPCAHLVCCAQCAPAIQKCAVCRKLVKGTVRVSFSY